MIKTIAIQNPRVIEIVARERTEGAGRSMTEAAENLILAEAERRAGDRTDVMNDVSRGRGGKRAETSAA